jgi:4-amino-4-deoxy-L-arabinose transferase-like glycosyltransferase
MTETRKNLLFLLACSTGLFIVSLLTRSLIPVDETRYTSVAWEMWLRGDYLVPYLNGATYSHKPPLLFWLFLLGWKLFGVNEWWPRLIPLLFSLGSLYLVHLLARLVWPQRDVHLYAPVILLGFTAWSFFSTAVMFDMMLAFFVLLAVVAMYRALSGDGYQWWLLTGVAWGLGMLGKGPVIFVHTLPLLLLAGWWLPGECRPSMNHGVKGFLSAFAIAAVIIFSWVVPAVLSGGEEYGRSLLLGQNIQRAVKAPNDALAWWFYLPVLPFLLFPWLYWGSLWRALAGAGGRAWLADHGIRFCLAWAISVFILFSLISGKKVHYLLPVLPALAMLFGALLVRGRPEAGRPGLVLINLVYLLIAAGIGYVALLYPTQRGSYWLAGLDDWSWLPFVLLALGGMLVMRTHPLAQARLLTLQSMLLLVLLHATVIIPAMRGFDLNDIARQVKRLQEQGITVAHLGKYQDEYHFLGRLRQPLVLLTEQALPAWLNEHPDAYVISYRHIQCGPAVEPADYMRLFRNGQCMTLRSAPQQQEYLRRQADNPS